ncbi:MAG: hypothetical protein AB8G99_00470 [Planctomycetaceae bacterium]
MRKPIGLIACVAVIAGSLWILGGGRPSQTAVAQVEDTGSYEAAARRFLQNAKSAAAQGDLKGAKQMAETAASFRVTWGQGEQTPEQFLKTLVTASGSGQFPDDEVWTQPPADAAISPFANQTQAESKTTQSRSVKGQATALLRKARVAMARGAYEEARARALQARQLGVTYGLWDDRPEHVLAEIERLTGQSTVVGSAPPKRDNPAHPDQTRDTAVALVQSARLDLRAGRIESARQKAAEAQKYNATFGPQEDSPELILKDASRMEASSVKATPATTSPERTTALALVEKARKALKEGRLSIAREQALAASRMNVEYQLWDDRPELVMADIQTALGQSATAATPAPPVETEISAADFAPDQSEAGSVAVPLISANDFDVIDTAGETAVQAFERGVVLLRQNDRAEAHEAFMKAQRSGEKLDDFRQEELTKHLASFDNIRKDSQISLVSAQETTPVSSSDFGDEMLFDDPEPAQEQNAELPELDTPVPAPAEVAEAAADDSRVFDKVTQKDAVRYDRLRTEVLNSVFRAEKLRDSNPDGAIALLDRSVGNVEASQLGDEAKQTLLGYLKRSQEAVKAYAQERAPLIALEQRNAEVKEALKADMKTKVRIEQEFANMVEKYNDLMEERRYAEAVIVAKQARELDPDTPASIVMLEKAKFARQITINKDIRERRADGALAALTDVEESLMPTDEEISYPKNWGELTKSRKRFGGADSRKRSDKEREIEKALDNPISLSFMERPFTEVVNYIAQAAAVDVVVDRRALEEEDVLTDEPVSIDVDGIRLRSALNLLLEPYGLTYSIKDDVLKITSKLRQEVDYEVRTYQVADLVVSMDRNNKVANPFSAIERMNDLMLSGGNLSSGVGSGGGLFQVNDGAGRMSGGGMPGTTNDGSSVDFESLVDLITSTIEPKSWIEGGGDGTAKSNENTLSLVIRQNPQIHEQIAELLDQLRRLQDLQVTVEVRFISVTDRFFERIGIDFDFAVQDTVGDVPGLPAFGSRQLQFPGAGGAGGGGGGQQGGDLRGAAGGQGGAGGAGGQQGAQNNILFDPVFRVRPSRDDFSRTVVGLQGPDTFTEDFDIQFKQGSFQIGVPDFGNFNPDAGIQVGMAILSDLEAFFFLQAAQADERANLLFAPKVTLFNGSSATIQDTLNRPFVIALVPNVGTGAVGFTPIVQTIPEGIFLNVTAVISADRRYVRLQLSPNFTNIVDVFTFSFASGGAGVGGIGGAGGGGIGGGGIGGGGIGGGAGGGIAGIGGIGGFGGAGGGAGGGVGGGVGGGAGGQQGQAGGGGGGTLTVQQPVVEIISVGTTVSVPDGGTVLLGGIKRLREGRNMAGVPILNKIPYISRLFKNSGVGRDTESVMLMVTPRIIIQEEEEELVLGTLVN